MGFVLAIEDFCDLFKDSKDCEFDSSFSNAFDSACCDSPGGVACCHDYLCECCCTPPEGLIGPEPMAVVGVKFKKIPSNSARARMKIRGKRLFL